MSSMLSKALRTSLESEEAVVHPTDAIVIALQEVIAEGSDVTEPVLQELVEDVNSASVGAQAIDEIAAQAETFAEAPEETDLAPALESMLFATGVLLKSQGVGFNRTSLESTGDARVGLGQLATQLRGKSKTVRQHITASMEDTFDDIRGNVGKIENVISNSDRAISAALAKIKNNARGIDESPITFNNRGIYDFMYYEGRPLTTLDGVMKRELDNLGKLMSAAGRFSALYVQLSKEAHSINGSNSANIRKFISTLMSVNVKKELYMLEGISFLNNGRTKVMQIDNIEDYDQFEDEEGSHTTTTYGESHDVLALCYNHIRGDGSKAPKAEKDAAQKAARTSGIKWGAGIGAVAGLVAGGALGALAIGALGALTFGIINRASGGVRKDDEYKGTLTESVTSSKELITFMEDCLRLPKMVRPLYNAVMFVGMDNDSILKQFNAGISTMSGNEVLARTLGEVAGALLTGGRFSVNQSLDNVNQSYSYVVEDQLDAIHVAHTSICEAAAYHAYMLTKVSASVCEQLLIKLDVK
jgi:hypothetical protein